MSKASGKLTVPTGAVPWREFAMGYQIGMRALGGEIPDELLQGLDEAPDGPRTQAARERLEKDPNLRVSLSVREYFGPSYPLLRPLLYRFWSLYDLVHRGQVDEWVTRNEDGSAQSLHSALLLAAAEVKLTKKGKLPANRFRERVEELANSGIFDQPAAQARTDSGDGGEAGEEAPATTDVDPKDKSQLNI